MRKTITSIHELCASKQRKHVALLLFAYLLSLQAYAYDHTIGVAGLKVERKASGTDGGLFVERAAKAKVTAVESTSSFTDIAWGTAASQPYTVSEAQGEVVNGKLYSFGGFDSQKSTFTPTSRAYSYDPVANTWKAIAPMPPMNGTSYGGVTHAGFATDGTAIYFAGGYTSNSSGTGQIFGTKEVWKYIISENRYERLPDLPLAVAAGQLKYLNGKLHHIGGTNAARTSDLGNHYVLQLNNLATGWESLAQLPSPRQHAGSAVYAGEIYYIGGQTGHDSNLITSKLVHRYDPATDAWTQVADLPVPSGANGRGHISSSVIVVDDRILVLGGETVHSSGRTNMVSAYTPATNTWKNLTPLPQARYSGVAALLGADLYYTGGSKSSITYKGVPAESVGQQVSGFTLVNADTKQDIQALTSGSTLNLATLATKNLNIRASTNPSTVGSVVFALSGTQSKNVTESKAPYDLMGDNGAWSPAVGNYTLKATPYTSSGGGGTAGTALAVSFSVVNQESDPNQALISNVSATSGRSYALAELAVGVKAYTDRTYDITSVPAPLAGAAMVRSANDDKASTSASLLSFTLGEGATVYVAYDPRATALPSWLSGWQKLAERVGVNDSKISHMDLYSKAFPAGTVTLGGNLQSPAAGALNNYFVVAKAGQSNTNQEVKINFQLTTTTTPSGYKADTGLAFDASRGYGWVDPSTKQPKDHTKSMRERTSSVDMSLKTLAQMQSTANGETPGTWEHIVPNGSYDVTVSAGDPSYLNSAHQLNVEGTAAIVRFVPTDQEKFRTATVTVNVQDGKLTIDAAGGSNTKINYMSIKSIDPNVDFTPPVVAVSVSGKQQSPNVYVDEALVNINASDEGGSGVAAVEYSVNNGPFTAYSTAFKVSTAGNYTVVARAKDGSSNTTTSSPYSFSVVKASDNSNAYMVVENLDKFAGNDILTASLIQIPWRRSNGDGTYTPYNENHNKLRLKISNKGTGALNISSLALSNTSNWKILSLDGAAYDLNTSFPMSLSAGTSTQVVIEFIAQNLSSRVKVQTDKLFIYSNDAIAPYKEIKLHGLWQYKGEGSNEPWAQEIIRVFGYTSRTGYNFTDGTIDGTTVVPNSDEIVSPFFVRADPSKPVSVVQMAAYHGCCSSTERFRWYYKESTTYTTLFTHNALDGQSLMPRKSGSTTTLAQGTFNPTGAFGIRVENSFSDRTRNHEGRIGIRIWKAIDAAGNIIPNAYIMSMDYLGTAAVNYDYNDNMYFVSNVRPETGPAYYSELRATPSANSFGNVLAGSSKSLRVTLNNSGGSGDPDITIQRVEVVGPDLGEFSVAAPAATTLAAQASTSVTVNFTPGGKGIKNAILLVHYNNSSSPLRIPLYGVADESGSTIAVFKRIKGAADSNITISGNVWEADINYRKGSIKLDKQVVTTPIAATDDDVLYQTYLSAATDLSETRYEVPIANGDYMVRMHFVENFFSAEGARVFNITLENELKLNNLDIFREVGYRAALVKDFEVKVTDGVLDMKFNPTANRLAIAGVEIFKASASMLTSTSDLLGFDAVAGQGDRELRVYPNPNSGERVYVEVENFGGQEAVTVTIHDIVGRVVASMNLITGEDGSARVEVPKGKVFGRGMYIIKAESSIGKVQTKMLVN